MKIKDGRTLYVFSTLRPTTEAMPRIPYFSKEAPEPIATEIRTRWSSYSGIAPLFTTLLHAPPVAEGWLVLAGAIRTASTLEDDLREIIVSILL